MSNAWLTTTRPSSPDRRSDSGRGSPGGQPNSVLLTAGNSRGPSAFWRKRSEVTDCSSQLIRMIRRSHYTAASSQPQTTIPDVFLWLVSGRKRLAYVRIPAYSILFSLVEEQRGRDSGRLTTLYMKVKVPKLKIIHSFCPHNSCSIGCSRCLFEVAGFCPEYNGYLPLFFIPVSR